MLSLPKTLQRIAFRFLLSVHLLHPRRSSIWKPLAVLVLLSEVSTIAFMLEPPGRLTRRELVVLSLLAEGLSNREIADRLHLSLNTVQTHLRHVYQKLGVRDRTQAILWFLKNVGKAPDMRA